jgi:hypothetical protein
VRTRDTKPGRRKCNSHIQSRKPESALSTINSTTWFTPCRIANCHLPQECLGVCSVDWFYRPADEIFLNPILESSGVHPERLVNDVDGSVDIFVRM